MKLEKAILKLTDRDYMENGMADLILDYDSAYNINIRVFKELSRAITGWPGVRTQREPVGVDI